MTVARIQGGNAATGKRLFAGVGPDCVGYRANPTRKHCDTGADADNTPGAALRDGPEWLGYRDTTVAGSNPAGFRKEAVAQMDRASCNAGAWRHARPARKGKTVWE